MPDTYRPVRPDDGVQYVWRNTLDCGNHPACTLVLRRRISDQTYTCTCKSNHRVKVLHKTNLHLFFPYVLGFESYHVKQGTCLIVSFVRSLVASMESPIIAGVAATPAPPVSGGGAQKFLDENSDWQSAPPTPEGMASPAPPQQKRVVVVAQRRRKSTTTRVLMKSPLREVSAARLQASQQQPQQQQQQHACVTPRRLNIPPHMRREALDDSPHWSPKRDGKHKMLHNFRRIATMLPQLRHSAISFCDGVLRHRVPKSDSFFSALSKWTVVSRIQKHTDALDALLRIVGEVRAMLCSAPHTVWC